MATACGFSKELDTFIDDWKLKPGNLIMILHKVQEEQGYISKAAATEVANRTENPLARVYGTMSFYHLFKTVKPGKKHNQHLFGNGVLPQRRTGSHR